MNEFFRYDSLPLVEEVKVFLLNEGEKRPDYSSIRDEIKYSSEQYGFEFNEINSLMLIKPTNAIIKLCIVIIKDPFSEDLTQMLLKMIDSKLITCASIAFEYSSETEMFSYVKQINKYKNLSKDRINFLRPNKKENGKMKVAAEKIIENSICDSVRVKYKPIRVSSLTKLKDTHKKYFKLCSKIYTDETLYHRSKSDGYFALRSDSNAESFFITATKTYKDNLNTSRISEVLSYNSSTNELKYNGKYLPSSDSVEASVIFKHYPQIKAVMHTHASYQFTRNPHFKSFIKVPISPYGEYSTGLLISDAIKNNEFIILEDHGEVFVDTELCVPRSLEQNLELYKRS